jgi:YidC/Oxa1 family membrane protein insertase
LDYWQLIILSPVLNTLIVLSSVLFNSFGLAIIALTIFTRILMYPLTIKQLRSTKAMQSLQPKLMELQKKYAKDKNKLGQEQMRMYREAGVSPAGCMVPMLVQMPIWIALFQAIYLALAKTPEALLKLSASLYDWSVVYTMLPLDRGFMGLDLASPNFVLALLVGVSMWVQQRMVSQKSADPSQQRQSEMMLWMMPMLFFFFSLQFPSGLALYWVVSNIISIVMQYFVTGWGGLKLPFLPKREVPKDSKYQKRIAEVEKRPSADVSAGTDIVASDAKPGKGEGNGGVGDKRQERRSGYQKSVKQIRRQSRTSRRSNPKRR